MSTRVVEAPVEQIEVPENRLRELKDYTGLAESMRELGLLQPITVTEAGVLVSGRHRLEAARSLGWEKIDAVVVEDDDLKNRLVEIDENLKRLDLTVYEQSKHAEERERVLEALGQRQKVGGDRRSESSRNGCGVKSTADVAKEAGMSERSWQNRTRIGKGLGEQTRAVLDMADPSDEKQRNLLNSTTQLDHLANISSKRGDEVAAEVAERALTEDGGNTFKAYEAVRKERKIEDPEADALKKSFAPTEAEKAWKNFSSIMSRLHELAAGVDAAGGIHKILRRQPEQNQRIFVRDYRALAERALRQVEEFEQQKGGDLNEFQS